MVKTRLLSQHQQRVHRQHRHLSTPGQPLSHRAGGTQTSERARSTAEDDGIELLKTQRRLHHERLNRGNQMGRGLGATLALMLPACDAAVAQDLDGHRHALGTGVKRQQVHAAALRWIRTPNKMPKVTKANPASRFHCSGSPRKTTAPKAESPGTSAVIMVERTGP